MQDNFVILLFCLSQHTFVNFVIVSYALRFPKYHKDNYLPQFIFLEIMDTSEMNSQWIQKNWHRAVKTGKPAVHLMHLSSPTGWQLL